MDCIQFTSKIYNILTDDAYNKYLIPNCSLHYKIQAQGWQRCPGFEKKKKAQNPCYQKARILNIRFLKALRSFI